MKTMIQKIEESSKYLKKQGIENGAIGIILGTGLSDLVNYLVIEKEIPFEDIPNFRSSTVEHQTGKLIYGSLSSKKVLVFQGRFHLYEGYNFFEITYPVRVMNELGVKKLIISNAAGAINLDYNKGEIMLIEDHINLQGGSPLAEKGVDCLGNRFVDMSEPYDTSLKDKAIKIAETKKITLHKGIYAAVVGPQLETKAEYRYLKIIGADAVGMSTVPEVIVANQLGIDCIAFSVLTDVCDPENLEPIDINNIMEMAKKGEQSLIILVKQLISFLKLI
jgi:purine-nucleoside phosphorylase